MNIEDFREYLLNTKTLNSKKRKLGKTSASHYFQKFISVLSYTFNKGLADISTLLVESSKVGTKSRGLSLGFKVPIKQGS